MADQDCQTNPAGECIAPDPCIHTMPRCMHENIDVFFERMGGQIIVRRWIECADCGETICELPNDLDGILGSAPRVPSPSDSRTNNE